MMKIPFQVNYCELVHKLQKFVKLLQMVHELTLNFQKLSKLK